MGLTVDSSQLTDRANFIVKLYKNSENIKNPTQSNLDIVP